MKIFGGAVIRDVLFLRVMEQMFSIPHTMVVSFKMEWGAEALPDNADHEAIQASLILMSHGASNLQMLLLTNKIFTLMELPQRKDWDINRCVGTVMVQILSYT